MLVTSAQDDGSAGTLRWAIQHAAAGDTIAFDPIVFSSSHPQTIKLAGPFLDVRTDLTLEGPGAAAVAIDGSDFYTLLWVQPGVHATISGMTFTHSHGAGSVGGGIENQGALTVRDCTFSHNSAVNDGGAIESTGALAVIDCTFMGNSAQFTGGAIDDFRSTMTVSGCTFAGNSAGIGGAVEVFHGDAAIADSTLTLGYAQSGAGASVESGNLFMSNCTVYGNGGLSGAGIFLNSGTATLNNTIVAGNSGDIVGTVSGSNNLVGDGSGGLTVGNHNLLGSTAAPLDPKLASLADNGGPTQTMALLPDSPAIDAGLNLLALGTDGKLLTTDQRGDVRVAHGTVDIGAYEAGASLPGDIDGNGVVNFADLLVLAQHYSAQVTPWTDGDLNGDGKVDFTDLLGLAQHYKTGSALVRLRFT